MKLFLSITAVLLFVFGYQICWFVYPDQPAQINQFTDLRYNIYAVVLLCCFWTALIDSQGVIKLILGIGIGMSINDVVDRYFGVYGFTEMDKILIPLAIIIPLIQYYGERKRHPKSSN